MDEVLSTWIRTSITRDFILLIADRVSGVHDEKGKQRPISGHIDGSTVEIEFDGSEQLMVLDASEIEVLPDGDLVIGHASEVRFSWRSNQPDGGALPCEEVFRIQGRYFDFRRTGVPFNTQISLVFLGRHIVRLRPVKSLEEV